MKYFFSVLICLISSIPIHSQGNSDSDTIFQTRYYSFHNNMWMNLHHFFYEQASHRQINKLKEDGLSFVDIGDSLKLSKLSSQEKKIFDEGVWFYRKNIIDQELLNSGRIFRWLQA